jgi:endonuclease YncB( thermonuclease family)
MRRNLMMIIMLVISSAFTLPQEWSAKVTKVIDGNTLEILTSDNETYKVLLKEIDCPEIQQSFGAEAKKLTEKLLLKKKVTVIVNGKDRWGNRLVSVTLSNGKDINQELLKRGFAWHNTRLSSNSTLKSLESQAKTGKIGLWEKENPTPPWIFRRQQTMKVAKSR